LPKRRVALVSPANSYGHMDGGIDASYVEFFGARLQLAVYEAIGTRPRGQLPVGSAALVRTGHRRIPFLIVAPTMEIPGPVTVDHAYRALRAVLRLAMKHPTLISDVFCPGLATGIGEVAPCAAATAMAEVYRDHLSSR
jgi:O-acetyl-ADP-ribose deacetylase (regulator of RNase III)